MYTFDQFANKVSKMNQDSSPLVKMMDVQNGLTENDIKEFQNLLDKDHKK